MFGIWPWPLTYNPNLAKVKWHTEYQGRRSNCSAVRGGRTDGRYQVHYLPRFAVDKEYEQMHYTPRIKCRDESNSCEEHRKSDDPQEDKETTGSHSPCQRCSLDISRSCPISSSFSPTHSCLGSSHYILCMISPPMSWNWVQREKKNATWRWCEPHLQLLILRFYRGKYYYMRLACHWFRHIQVDRNTHILILFSSAKLLRNNKLTKKIFS